MDERDVEVALERLDHLRRLVAAQQAVVDEDADELVADRLVHEQRGDRGVDAARERAEDARAADLGPDALDLLLDHGRGRPGRRSVGDRVEEVLQEVGAVRRVDDLGVELHAVELLLGVLERGDRRRLRAGGHACARRAARSPSRGGSSSPSARAAGPRRARSLPRRRRPSCRTPRCRSARPSRRAPAPSAACRSRCRAWARRARRAPGRRAARSPRRRRRARRRERARAGFGHAPRPG